jgi:hypothetical protein
MSEFHRWERETLAPRYEHEYEGTGTRLRLVAPLVGTLAVVVRYPGTLWRVYWNGGRMTDHRTEAEAIDTVERHFSLR